VKQFFDLVQLDRPFVLPLKLSEGVNLPARDLIALDRALLSVERAHIADEGLRDLGRQFDGLGWA
jgi:hypothetical protein